MLLLIHGFNLFDGFQHISVIIFSEIQIVQSWVNMCSFKLAQLESEQKDPGTMKTLFFFGTGALPSGVTRYSRLILYISCSRPQINHFEVFVSFLKK